MTETSRPLAAFETLSVERRGRVGWLIFDRPESGNAINAQMFDDLETAWAVLEEDPEVSVIVNTGRGRAFQTGLDVVQLARDPAALKKRSRQTREAALKLTAWHCGVTKPVIAAVNGTCAGGGLHFIADADIVVLSERASLLDPHVSVGQVSAFETIGLITMSPAVAVLRMALLGIHERMGAERARQLGLCSEVCAPDELDARTQEIAETIALHDPSQLAGLKAQLWAALETP